MFRITSVSTRLMCRATRRRQNLVSGTSVGSHPGRSAALRCRLGTSKNFCSVHLPGEFGSTAQPPCQLVGILAWRWVRPAFPEAPLDEGLLWGLVLANKQPPKLEAHLSAERGRG